MKCENCTCTYESCSCYNEGSDCAYEDAIEFNEKQFNESQKTSEFLEMQNMYVEGMLEV